MIDEVATRDSFHNEPMPEKCSVIELPHLRFNPPEIEKLRRGFVPEDMDERWFIFYEEGHLYFHRSWTGFMELDVRIRECEDGTWELVDLVANREPEQYRNEDDAYDAKNAVYLMGTLLLGIDDLPVPVPPWGGSSPIARALATYVSVGERHKPGIDGEEETPPA